MKRSMWACLLLALLPVSVFAQQPPRPLPTVLDDLDKLVAELRALVAPPVPPARVTAVPCTGSAQEAFAAAKPGDTITLIPGCRYVVGGYTLGPKAAVVTVRSAAPTLPDRRIDPTDAALLPILASGNNGPVLDGTGAKHWRFDGIQFEATANGAGEILPFQEAEDISLDRILIVAGMNGQKRAIRANGKDLTVTRSYIANISAPGQDSQAICAWDGTGPITITDNFLEAASENVMIGGADSSAVDKIPSDVLIERNLFSKRVSWKGQGRAVKNLFELKVGRRVTVRDNVFEHNWTDGQSGYAILIKSVDQDGGAPWSVTEDVLFENNIVRDTDNGVNILGIDYLQPSGQTTRVTFRRNLIQTRGVGFQIGGEVGTLTIDRNTIENGYTLMSLYGGGVWPTGASGVRTGMFAIANLTLTGNLMNHNDYGIKGDSTSVGAICPPGANGCVGTFTRWVQTWTMTNNVLLGGAGYASKYPPTTWFDLASVPAGVSVGR